MKSVISMIMFLTLALSVNANADCVKNQYGKVVCGKGQCETDRYGKVFCAENGGGAIKDKHGDVQCGVGYCAKDYLDEVWCSKEKGEAAAVDLHEKVKCLGGCEPGSSKLCKEAQEAK